MTNTSGVPDNASSISHTSSFSTRSQSKQQPPRQLRRVKTMTQLTRWVTQRISRPSLRNSASGNELSETNLNDLDMITTVIGDLDGSDPEQSSQGKPSLVVGQTKVIETIQEDMEEAEVEKADLDTVREIRLRRSYAAFCEEFTLSGPQQPKRRFEVSMDVGTPRDGEQLVTHSPHYPMNTGRRTPKRGPVIAMQPGSEHSRGQNHIPSRQSPRSPEAIAAEHTDSFSIGHGSQTTKEEADMHSVKIAPTTHPRPPPHVLTPSIYQEVQRVKQEHKRARRQRFWGHLWSFFSRSQPLRGHRVELE